MSLNSKQMEVVLCVSHCVALACPGSGKTTVIAYKVEYILRSDPNTKVVITSFTKASANDIRRRIIELIGEQYSNRIDTGTFHSLALNQLREAGFKGNIIRGNQVKQYVQRALESSQQENMNIDLAVEIVEKCRSNLFYVPTNDDLGRLYTSYVNLLKKSKTLDFSGILSNAVKLMRAGKLQPIACNYLFCDEAQDMDEIQHAWCVEHIKAGAIITVVGDDDQSIYKFRGALGFEGMMRFNSKYNAKLIKLGTNYRCHEEILSAAGKLIEHNANRIHKNLEAHKGKGGTIEGWQCTDAISEANLVVRKIIETCSGNHNSNPEKYSVAVKECEWAVLARNNHNLNAIAMAFIENKIPYSFKEEDEWAEAPVCFAVELLSSLVSGEMAGIESALHYSGIDQRVLAKCAEIFSHEFEIFVHYSHEGHLVELGPDLSAKILKFAKLIALLEGELKKGRVNQVIQGVFNWFIGQINSRHTQKERNYQHEVNSLKRASAKLSAMEGTLKQRLQRIMIGIKSESRNGNKIPSVYLGTLHSVKGLEFKYVWILQVDHGVIPDEKCFFREAIEEERRLLFVGMTRAEVSLYISSIARPSQFVAEAGIQMKFIL